MKKTGLWIDHKRAVIVTITDQGEEIKQILSNVERQGGRIADSRHSESHAVRADDRRDHKFTGLLNGFYDEVLSSIHQSESILIFGPGEAKGELQKWIEHKNLGGRIVGVETVDKMTHPQVADKVRKYFSGENSPAPKRNPQRKEDDMNKNNHKNLNHPNPAPALSPQQPKMTPDLAHQQPKTTQSVAPQPIRDIPRTTKLTHDDIAKRAYEIYAEKGDRQGDSEQNWKQAEHELKK